MDWRTRNYNQKPWPKIQNTSRYRRLTRHCSTNMLTQCLQSSFKKYHTTASWETKSTPTCRTTLRCPSTKLLISSGRWLTKNISIKSRAISSLHLRKVRMMEKWSTVSCATQHQRQSATLTGITRRTFGATSRGS